MSSSAFHFNFFLSSFLIAKVLVTTMLHFFFIFQFVLQLCGLLCVYDVDQRMHLHTFFLVRRLSQEHELEVRGQQWLSQEQEILSLSDIIYRSEANSNSSRDMSRSESDYDEENGGWYFTLPCWWRTRSRLECYKWQPKSKNP